MNFPADLKYSKEHEWVRVEGNKGTVGITDFAQKELGDIVYVDITTLGDTVTKDAVFGTVEAVKTVSDLFLPVSGKVLEQNKDAGYTTTLKLMQIMLDKGLLKRDASNKSHVYTANISQEKTQGQLVQRMIDNVFNGSASQLVMQALGNYRPSVDELNEIKKYLDEIEGTSAKGKDSKSK